jgi:hypothetical protein
MKYTLIILSCLFIVFNATAKTVMEKDSIICSNDGINNSNNYINKIDKINKIFKCINVPF